MKSKKDIPMIVLMSATAVAVLVTGILYRQPFFRMIPLFVSLFVGALQSRANRHAALIGGINSILYAIVFFTIGIYASAVYALAFSFPVQLVTFILWSKNKYKSTTHFKKLSGRARLLIALAFTVVTVGVIFLLDKVGSLYSVVDSVSSMLGILVSLLTMLAYVEYTYLMIPSGVIGGILCAMTMRNDPGQITYVIFSVYSLICVTKAYFSVKKFYAEENSHKENAQ